MTITETAATIMTVVSSPATLGEMGGEVEVVVTTGIRMLGREGDVVGMRVAGRGDAVSMERGVMGICMAGREGDVVGMRVVGRGDAVSMEREEDVVGICMAGREGDVVDMMVVGREGDRLGVERAGDVVGIRMEGRKGEVVGIGIVGGDRDMVGITALTREGDVVVGVVGGEGVAERAVVAVEIIASYGGERRKDNACIDI